MKRKNLLLLFSVLFCMVLLLSVSCDRTDGKDTVSPNVIKYNIHTQAQSGYLSGEPELFSSYAAGKEELSYPLPVTLSWAETDGDAGYSLLLSEYADMSFPEEYTFSSASAQIYNLKPGTTYYWSVSGSDGINSFTVEAGNPRNLRIDGLTNCRDLGGYMTLSGKTTSYGMIYRTSKLTDDYSGEELITADGKAAAGRLHIRSELDLRRTSDGEQGGITESPLGSGITYISFPMRSSGNVMTLNKELLPGLFAILGNADNYPIDIHCSIGTDRTGYVCFLISALLGVSEEWLYKDYLFSNFGNIGRMRTTTAVDDYIKTINRCEGDSFAEKTENYLLLNGVSENDIENLRSIMLK